MAAIVCNSESFLSFSNMFRVAWNPFWSIRISNRLGRLSALVNFADAGNLLIVMQDQLDVPRSVELKFYNARNPYVFIGFRVIGESDSYDQGVPRGINDLLLLHDCVYLGHLTVPLRKHVINLVDTVVVMGCDEERYALPHESLIPLDLRC